MRIARTHFHRALLASMALLAACGSSTPSNGGNPDAGGAAACVGGGGSTVVGQVIDSRGQPVAGRSVVQGSRSTTTTASGCFTFTGVTMPYDAAIIQTTGTPYAIVFTGLTRTDPTLTDIYLSRQPARTTTVTGNLTVPPGAPASVSTGVVFSSPEASVGRTFTSNPWSLSVSWNGPTSTTGNVHALQWTNDANGSLTGFFAYGVRNGVTLQSGTAFTGADVTLTTPVTTQAVVGAISVPSGYTLSERAVYVTFPDRAAFLVGDDTLTSVGFAFPFPSGIGASALVYAAASDGTSTTEAQSAALPAGTSNATVTLPSPALPTAPASGATGVGTSTDLVWSPVAGAVYEVVLTGSGTDPVYVLLTSSTTARIPDLSAQGLGLPSARSYSWTVNALGPLTSVDALASPSIVLTFDTSSGPSQFTTR